MFGDWKDHGWDIESTHLRQPARLSRLVLALALLYIWLVLWGARLIKAGCRAWVDRADRRDLSLFRIGLDTLHRCFALARELPIPSPSLVQAQVSGSYWYVTTQPWRHEKCYSRPTC
jgi:hypothetical protein